MWNTTPFTMRRRQLSDGDSVWSEHDTAPTPVLTSTAAMERVREVSVSRDVLERFERILGQAPSAGETYGAAAARKEREVLHAIGELSAADALCLQRMIESGASAFERLTSERRQRVVRALQRYRVLRSR